MSKPFKVDVSPDMSMYRLLQNQSYSVYSALSEFVDNSVQSYLDKRHSIETIDKKRNNLKINIFIDSRKKEMIISDNAHGINRENFQKAIKMGINAMHKKSSLSKFGVGMKTAAVWLSNTWIIETSALNSKEKLICKFDLNKLLTSGETEISVSSEEEKQKEHYTNIIIKNSLRIDSKKYYEEKLIPHLEETFIKFKNFLSIEVKYNDEILPKKWKKKNKAYFKQPEPLEYPFINKQGQKVGKTRRWKKKIELNYKNHQVKGFFLIMKTGSYEQPGLRLFRNNRIIEGTLINPNRPKVLFSTENKYGSQRFYGELHLNDFEIDFMKTKFNENLEDLYVQLKTELSKENFFDQVKNYQPTKLKDLEKPPDMQPDNTIILRKKDGITEKKSTKNINNILISEKIKNKLEDLKWKKTYNLYNSICTISLKTHPYLSYAGSWSFLECLASYMEKREGIPFKSFYDGKINSWYSKKEDKKRLKDVVNDIFVKGNASKHDPKYEMEDAKNLKSYFKVLEEFIVKCIEDIKDK